MRVPAARNLSAKLREVEKRCEAAMKVRGVVIGALGAPAFVAPGPDFIEFGSARRVKVKRRGIWRAPGRLR